MTDNKTVIEFVCPYTIEQRYEMAMTGQFGVFDMMNHKGEVTGYRGFRTGYGTTGVWSTYKEAFEAALTEFGHLTEPQHE